MATVGFWLFGFFLFFSFNSSVAEAATTPTRVVITFGSFSERETALFVAQDQGFFAKHHLDVKLVKVSGPVALAALAGGDSQFYWGAATGATLGAIAGGLDAVFVSSLIHKLEGVFVVSPAIKSPMDLRGMTIGVQSIGGGIWMRTMLALNHWRLEPKRDKIRLRVIGDEAALAQAFATGMIDGSYLGYTYGSLLERQGFRILADLAKLGIPYQNTALLGQRKFVYSSPDIVERVLRAFAETVSFTLEPVNKAQVMRSLAKGLRLPRLEDASEGYERVINLYERRIYPNVEGIRSTIELLGTTNENIRRLKAEDLVDDRFVKKLEQERGF
jgi:ABC-type nitrate/sulfonate/bicarbonate transport system substrate-binding protein